MIPRIRGDTDILLRGPEGCEIGILKRPFNRTVCASLDDRFCFIELGLGKLFNICFPVKILDRSSILTCLYRSGGCDVGHGLYFVDNHTDLGIGECLSERK